MYENLNAPRLFVPQVAKWIWWSSSALGVKFLAVVNYFARCKWSEFLPGAEYSTILCWPTWHCNTFSTTTTQQPSFSSRDRIEDVTIFIFATLAANLISNLFEKFIVFRCLSTTFRQSQLCLNNFLVLLVPSSHGLYVSAHVIRVPWSDEIWTTAWVALLVQSCILVCAMIKTGLQITDLSLLGTKASSKNRKMAPTTC